MYSVHDITLKGIIPVQKHSPLKNDLCGTVF